MKDRVYDYWQEDPCGEVYAIGTSQAERLREQQRARYELEPYIPEFARFPDGGDRDVLEIGVGMGADHAEWARVGPRSLTGVDLTPRAIEYTADRLSLLGLDSALRVADAEGLPFEDDSFDLVYSWGVLHHSPDTHRAIQEVYRVLRPGGVARIMVYHRHSLVGLMLYLRYGVLAGKPATSFHDIYARYLESPGTKAYSPDEVRNMCAKFTRVDVRTQLSFGDLLLGESGQRHEGRLLDLGRRLWPRRLLRRFARGFGLYLLIDAIK